MTKELQLAELLSDDERIAKYCFTGSYCEYECIIPNVSEDDIKHGYIDIAACLEDTLHRILENGSNEDAMRIMGVKIPTEEERIELEEFDEYSDVDLGYVIPGLLMNFQ